MAKKAKAKQEKVPVTERALLQRINRALAGEGRKLKKARGAAAIQELGRYFEIDKNFVGAKDCDLEQWGRELGVLKEYEALKEDS